MAVHYPPDPDLPRRLARLQLGRRVMIRRYLRGGQTSHLLTDVVGTVAGTDPLVVQDRHGVDHRIDPADIAVLKVLPARPVRARDLRTALAEVLRRATPGTSEPRELEGWHAAAAAESGHLWAAPILPWAVDVPQVLPHLLAQRAAPAGEVTALITPRLRPPGRQEPLRSDELPPPPPGLTRHLAEAVLYAAAGPAEAAGPAAPADPAARTTAATGPTAALVPLSAATGASGPGDGPPASEPGHPDPAPGLTPIARVQVLTYRPGLGSTPHR